MYHKVGRVGDGCYASFAQLYFTDDNLHVPGNANNIPREMRQHSHFDEFHAEILRLICAIMENNPIARFFRHAYEVGAVKLFLFFYIIIGLSSCFHFCVFSL